MAQCILVLTSEIPLGSLVSLGFGDQVQTASGHFCHVLIKRVIVLIPTLVRILSLYVDDGGGSYMRAIAILFLIRVPLVEELHVCLYCWVASLRPIECVYRLVHLH